MQYNGIDGGGPVLYPITDLQAGGCVGLDCETAGPQEAVYAVDGSFGDVEQQINDGGANRTGTILSFGQIGGSTQPVGLRFAGINVARGATIVDARLELVARSNRDGNTSLLIEIEDAADAVPYGTTNDEVTSRNYASDTVPWVPEAWISDEVYQSEDIAQLVQSVASRSDWCSGNSLAFSVTGIGSRQAHSWESGVSQGRGGTRQTG